MTTPLPITEFEVPTTSVVYGLSMASNHEALTLARQAIDELRASHPESTPSNVQAVYMSPWKSHTLNDKLKPLTLLIEQLVTQVVHERLNTDLSKLGWRLSVTDCWGAIYEETDHTLPHTHFPADFAVVLYLEAGPQCAPLVFDSGVCVKPQQGTLVIFPGGLKHHVPHTADRRVVVAMNLYKLPALA